MKTSRAAFAAGVCSILVIAMPVFAEGAGTATSTQSKPEVVYRCPGPPIVFVDAISAEVAKAKNCIRLDVSSPKPNSPKTMADLRRQFPSLSGLNDDEAVTAIHRAFYADLPREVIAKHLGVKPAEPKIKQTLNWAAIDEYFREEVVAPKPPKELGLIDSWRYRSCQQEATKAPTPIGVQTGMRLCKEQFEQ